MRIESRTVGAFAENCYLLVDEESGRGVLVDPGDDGERIIDMVAKSGAVLDAIWLTHAHLDHIGAINTVRARYAVPVYLHPLDLPFYERLSAHASRMYGLPWDQPEAATLPIAEGDRLTCGTLEFVVMHVPGHAPGQVSFNGHGVAISGDLLFSGSIGRTDLPLSDPYAMDVSLEHFAALPASTVVYPGHGTYTTIGKEIETNPFLSGRARTVKR
ncbi:MAG: MBL fold metallo-hydrolase [Gemmatimonadota bacterium]|nr:MBL fold metallo-hydrolase [Gemmatimonadota bacterium]